MIVVDSSVLANAIGDDGADGSAARLELATAGEFSAPDLVDVEVVKVLRKLWLNKVITVERFSEGIEDLHDLPMDRYPTLPLMRRAFELRENVTPYDCAYIALAETLNCELLTADKRLSTAPGIMCPIKVIKA